jgi:hypothetical protein
LAETLRAVGLIVNDATGEQASESYLYTIHDPQLLVIASHGLFFSNSNYISMKVRFKSVAGETEIDTAVGKSQSGSRPDLFGDYLFEQLDPNMISMIALAGASDVPQFGKPYGVHSGTDDGFLTAYEAQLLRLRTTELVLLVGCHTASGKPAGRILQVPGDNISGFRQAFETAVARSVVGTLWAVPDEQATKYARSFLLGWLEGRKPKYCAHRAAQLELLKQAREHQQSHPLWWAGFVFQGDPGDIGTGSCR